MSLSISHDTLFIAISEILLLLPIEISDESDVFESDLGRVYK